jgi:3-oxoacyl-[acyl-carrier-protein] synthase-3
MLLLSTCRQHVAASLFLMETGANFIRSGRYKKVIIVGGDKMSSMVDYTDRATCPIFGDGAAALCLEPTTEDVGILDSMLRTDGKGLPFLHMKAGGSVCTPSYFTIDNKMHSSIRKVARCSNML